MKKTGFIARAAILDTDLHYINYTEQYIYSVKVNGDAIFQVAWDSYE